MMKRIVQLLLAFTGGVLGYLFIADLTYLSLGMVGLDSLPGWLVNNYTGALAGALILYLLFFWSVDPIVRFIQLLEDKLMNFPVADLIFGTVGLVVGLLLAFLVTVAVNNIEIAFISAIVPIFLTLLLGYLGFQVGYKKKDELLGVFRQSKEDKDGDQANADEADARLPVPKLLDTSVIIDGRIADICQTGFLEGKLVIPNFVLEELQHIADSSDSLKRNRGRRGLDILKRIQKEIPIEVEITDEDFDEIQEVDSKLVKLAKKTNGLVVTNDFNLNKVCDLQGVSVLNINDLANAVKPVVLPGEEMAIQIIKDGKEQNQGIGYLDDGTMIVVEGGRNAIGKTIDVIVTSVLQTSAGRMIFAKPKSMDKAQ
ncbi:PIN/TRAM domain-containing protein [Salisediminibacterium selenitireducens]|uniref:PilT protein domain protein n=1 Tax=Bacillus selenitireducens (strain ATCC 700615 / DSM 15326 / MLS10) TaxID=439292 RepID=D6XV77_BACIE|nr:PIN/TRAM domain-containing protein [Salisediminibacterium selenitireducens]ADH97635.1 PilT protein domain protein [[Bacillus] selenitireducens MLS10]